MLELSVLALAAVGAWLVHVRRKPPRWLAVAAVAAVAFGVAAALTGLLGVPRPRVHDEWSYLFAADTFVSGRVTNPTPPAWQAFESFHVLVRPTYMSKYPPAQGLALAVGQRLTGLPIVGVWLSVGLLGASLCWCLLPFVGVNWACALSAIYLVRLLTTEHEGIGYWAHSYWGGALAASGGALVFGAARRLASGGARGRDGVLLVLGLALLANTRPFEGLFMAAPVVVGLVTTLWRRRVSNQTVDGRTFVAAGAIALVILAAMAYYDLRVTGDVLTLPYWEHESQYAAAPPMIFLNRRFPDYHVAAMAEFYQGERLLWQAHKTLRGFRELTVDKAQVAWSFYVGPLWTVVLLATPRVARDGSVRAALLAIGSTLLAYSTLNPVQAHYLAPLTAPLVVLLALCARWWAQRLGAERIVAMLAVVAVVTATTNVVKARAAPRDDGDGQDRTTIETRLGGAGGKHLVLVRYAPGHPPWNEWIYNRADLEAAPIVFARDDNLALSRLLVGTFHDRKPWQFDEATKELRPYVLPPALVASDRAR